MRFIFYRAVHTLALHCNVQNLSKHLLHYREGNGFRSNKTNSALHVSAFTCWIIVSCYLEIFHHLLIFLQQQIHLHERALFYQLDQAGKQPCEMRAQRAGTWQQINGRLFLFFFIVFYHFLKHNQQPSRRRRGLIRRILCTLSLWWIGRATRRAPAASSCGSTAAEEQMPSCLFPS